MPSFLFEVAFPSCGDAVVSKNFSWWRKLWHLWSDTGLPNSKSGTNIHQTYVILFTHVRVCSCSTSRQHSLWMQCVQPPIVSQMVEHPRNVTMEFFVNSWLTTALSSNLVLQKTFKMGYMCSELWWVAYPYIFFVQVDFYTNGGRVERKERKGGGRRTGKWMIQKSRDWRASALRA